MNFLQLYIPRERVSVKERYTNKPIGGEREGYRGLPHFDYLELRCY